MIHDGARAKALVCRTVLEQVRAMAVRTGAFLACFLATSPAVLAAETADDPAAISRGAAQARNNKLSRAKKPAQARADQAGTTRPSAAQNSTEVKRGSRMQAPDQGRPFELPADFRNAEATSFRKSNQVRFGISFPTGLFD